MARTVFTLVAALLFLLPLCRPGWSQPKALGVKAVRVQKVKIPNKSRCEIRCEESLGLCIANCPSAGCEQNCDKVFARCLQKCLKSK